MAHPPTEGKSYSGSVKDGIPGLAIFFGITTLAICIIMACLYYHRHKQLPSSPTTAGPTAIHRSLQVPAPRSSPVDGILAQANGHPVPLDTDSRWSTFVALFHKAMRINGLPFPLLKASTAQYGTDIELGHATTGDGMSPIEEDPHLHSRQ